MELLAPGGDFEAVKGAVLAGANAVYLGLDRFNARSRAVNIRFSDFYKILHFAHQHNCKVFVTLNILIYETELNQVTSLLNKLYSTTVDGIIVQDLGLLYLLHKYYPDFKIHASTQMTTHNSGQLEFLAALNCSRVNLCRELNLSEIKKLTKYAHNLHMETEVFIHGSYCISFSGICYISHFWEDKSGNRGKCSQPCRWEFKETETGSVYPLNLKDNTAFFDYLELIKTGVDSLKIEGRIKKYDYVYNVVSSWRKHLDNYQKFGTSQESFEFLNRNFNRGFSNGYLTGKITKEMYAKNPRDNSVDYYVSNSNYPRKNEADLKLSFFDWKANEKKIIKKKINKIMLEKRKLIILFCQENKIEYKIYVNNGFKKKDYIILIPRRKSDQKSFKKLDLEKKFLSFSEGELALEIVLKDLDDIYVSYKELNKLKRQINSDFKIKKTATIPEEANKKPQDDAKKIRTKAVLVSSEEQLQLRKNFEEIFFELPSDLSYSYEKYLDLFLKNYFLLPYFPSVVLGDNYKAAIEFLKVIRPQKIITNNYGIGFEAGKLGINWIAGQYLNLTNRYSLLLLQEKFNCTGGFLSPELNFNQIRQISCPENFMLYTCLKEPKLLMTSRQCLFRQVTGCSKVTTDEICLSNCHKTAEISDNKERKLIIYKAKGHYCRVFDESNRDNISKFETLSGRYDATLLDVRGFDYSANSITLK